MTVLSEAVRPANEEERNRILRRIDWRFLLPQPMADTAVCAGVDEPLLEAVRLISTRAVDIAQAQPTCADLAVIVDPNKDTLRAVWHTLRPGGACYVETRSRSPFGARSQARDLAAVGFGDVASFWPWPAPWDSAPRYWVPLEADGAHEYFLRSRRMRTGLLGSARQLALRSAWRCASTAGALAPTCMVARRPDGVATSRPGPGMHAELARTLVANWSEWGLGETPDRLSWMLLTGGESSFNKVVGLVFADSAPQPSAVIKLSRSATADAGLRNEADALAQVCNQRPRLRGVPRPLFQQHHGSGLASGQTVACGRPLEEVLARDNLAALAFTVTDWFSELAGRPDSRDRGNWWPRLVAPTLEAFAVHAHATTVAQLVARTRDLFHHVQQLPLTFSHGDAGPVNVLVDDNGAISVIDWEDCEPSGLPLADLILLLTFMFFHLEDPWRTGRFREVYRATLDPSTTYGALRAACLARYASRVGLTPEATRALGVVPWMRRSLREHQGMADATLGPEGREGFRRGLYASLWEEELCASTAVSW